MSDLDSRIKSALESASDESLYIGDEIKSLYRDITATFTGRYRVLLTIAWLKMIVIMILGGICIYLFFVEEDLKFMLAYGFAVVICFSSMITIAIFLWQEITKNNTSREIKRLELQIALLIDYLKENERSS